MNNEENPCGENAIVAIMAWNGYNVEDSILFNEGSLKRGLFRTTYYGMYESREESSKVTKTQVDAHFANIEKENVIGLKPGYDYSHLDEYGLIKENTPLDDKTVIIGKVVTNLENPDTSIDASTFPKKGQLGFVDKAFITEGEEGFRIAKVRVRDERVPAIGDKFASRCGQKGTIGLVIPEADMPFTAEGIRPDIIINPHAIPSRMTIGQLVETLMGKACCIYGGFGDCTAFVNKGPKNKRFGQMLNTMGFHSSGNELLYNGQTGEQLQSEIFIGPTYYMRLKHMVKDKINYRAQGPRTVLTRQTVGGRANDGGLRIGEMERDGLIAHGVTKFLQESMLIRGDEYFMAVCNKSGTIAIYNESYNLFLSPFADGPIKFNGTLTDKMNIENVSKYGRSFSILRIPYAFKLLIQELQMMNIQMRLITEDNIDQLTNMSFSDNVEKLSGAAGAGAAGAVGANIIRQINAMNMESNKKWDDKLAIKPERERTRKAPRAETSVSDTPWGEPVGRTYKKNTPKPIVFQKEETDVWGFPVNYKPSSPVYAPGSPSEYRPSTPGYSGPSTPNYPVPSTPNYPVPSTPNYMGQQSPEGPRTPIFQEAYSNVSPTYNMTGVSSPTFQEGYSNVSPTYNMTGVTTPTFQEAYSNVSPTYDVGSSTPVYNSNASPQYLPQTPPGLPTGSPRYTLSPTYSGTQYFPITPPGLPPPLPELTPPTTKQFVEIPYTYPTEPLLTTIETEGETEEKKSKTDSKKINVN